MQGTPSRQREGLKWYKRAMGMTDDQIEQMLDGIEEHLDAIEAGRVPSETPIPQPVTPQFPERPWWFGPDWKAPESDGTLNVHTVGENKAETDL